MEKFTCFYRTQSPFSQWHPACFVIDGITFNCAEQYMMYKKAVLFGDMEAAEKILESDSPSVQKKLGRTVKNFEKEKWNSLCKQYVYEANYAKFTQNLNLKEILLATAGTTLVEASPTDRIWGVGLSESNPLIKNRATWRGTNWLGETLTQLREDLVKEG